MSETKLFVLDVKADHETRTVSLRLSEREQLIASNEVRVEGDLSAMWEGLLQTSSYVRKREQAARAPGSTEPEGAAAAELVEQIGVFLGRQIIGPASIDAIAAGDDRRSLLVRFSGTSVDPLASALACLPWSIARPALGVRPLIQRNVVVRVAPPGAPPEASLSHATVAREPGEPLRVLLVFTEAPGGRPMASRLERERLRELFYDEIMPDRQVMLDILCHGVSRERLRQKLQDAGGYHVIHWSGYGHDAALDAAPEGDIASLLSGSDLAELIAEAGGFIPELVFLSAAHAGPLGVIHDWDTLRERLREPASGAASAPRPSSPSGSFGGAPLAQLLEGRFACGDTALELARAGVPQVVVTRQPAGGAYARRLARRFYRLLLATDAPHPVDSALALAQRELLADPRAAEHHPLDHASTVVLGERARRFELERGPSPDLELRRPQPQPLLRGRSDLDPPRGFAGRTSELGRLAVEWLPKRGAAVALMHGAEGLGKTRLAAEAIHLWHRQFHWVIAHAVHAPGLPLDDFYREIDKRLMRASPIYRERCKENEERRIFLPARQDLTGPERYELLRDNLVDVLSTASVLIVVDGFEANLGAIPVEDGYLCTDPEWDALLQTLVERLADVSGSRVIITSRLPVASLARSSEVVPLEVRPLLAHEALSLMEGTDSIAPLLRGGDAERALSLRVLEASSGQPMALKRLGDLAREGRPVLEAGLGASPSSPPATTATTGSSSEGAPPPPASPTNAQAAAPPASLEPRRERDETPPPVLSIRPAARPDRSTPQGPASPEQVADRAVAILMERLTPEERNLLWRISRAPAPVPVELIKRIKEIA